MAETQSSVEFREINGYPGYWITNTGEVWSFRFNKKRKMKPCEHRDGHLLIGLSKKNTKKTFYVHRLVLETFVGPCPPRMECLHKDGNPKNNVLSNLHWGTPKENKADQAKHGVIARGSRNGFAKLKETDISEIRRLRNAGWSQQRIGDELNVHQTQISRILRGVWWRHVS